MRHRQRRTPFPFSVLPLSVAVLCLAATLGPAVADTSSPNSGPATPNDTTTSSSAAAAKAGIAARPFRASSYWNTPLGRAPRDRHSRAYIRDSQKRSHTQGYLKLILGDWGMPMYRSSAANPLYRISAGGQTVRVHIPRRARQMPTDDAAMIVTDKSTRQVVGLFGARFSGGRWTASGISRYLTGSSGIAKGLPTGHKSNYGHRGIPGSVQAVTRAEIRRGVIRHRLEVYWWETASKTPSGRDAYFPMTNSESGKSGIVPEGSVIRIRPSVNLKALHLSRGAYIIARALQRYGAVVGDNGGSGNSMKLQGNAKWGGVLNRDSLRKIKWRDYVFVRGGHRP